MSICEQYDCDTVNRCHLISNDYSIPNHIILSTQQREDRTFPFSGEMSINRRGDSMIAAGSQ